MTEGEVQAFRLGDVFVEFGLDIELRSPARRTFRNGGYESRTANTSRLDPVTGEYLVAAAHALLDSMFR